MKGLILLTLRTSHVETPRHPHPDPLSPERLELQVQGYSRCLCCVSKKNWKQHPSTRDCLKIEQNSAATLVGTQ